MRMHPGRLHGQMRKKLRCVKVKFTYPKIAALVTRGRMLDFGLRAQKSRARDKDYCAMTLLDFETCRTVEGGEYNFLDFFKVYKTSSLERAEWCIDLLCNE
nr:hypothetical protein [Tanacetum cinerariifolium]